MNALIFLVKSGDKEHFYSVSTDYYYIMEIESVLHIKLENTNDDMENKIMKKIKSDPSILKKISQEIKDHAIFKRRVDAERTKRRLRCLNTIGYKYGTVYFPNSVLSDDNFYHINDLLGIKTDQ